MQMLRNGCPLAEQKPARRAGPPAAIGVLRIRHGQGPRGWGAAHHVAWSTADVKPGQKPVA